MRTIRRPVGVGSFGTSAVRIMSVPQEIRDGKVDLTRELVGKMDVTRQRIRAQQLTKQVSIFFAKLSFPSSSANLNLSRWLIGAK